MATYLQASAEGELPDLRQGASIQQMGCHQPCRERSYCCSPRSLKLASRPRASLAVQAGAVPGVLSTLVPLSSLPPCFACSARPPSRLTRTGIYGHYSPFVSCNKPQPSLCTGKSSAVRGPVHIFLCLLRRIIVYVWLVLICCVNTCLAELSTEASQQICTLKPSAE